MLQVALAGMVNCDYMGQQATVLVVELFQQANSLYSKEKSFRGLLLFIYYFFYFML